MDIPYLNGDEQTTAALVDKLFAGLDAKLKTLLGGRSFFLAQTAQMPQYLIGKAFFFTSGSPVYAPRVPGYIAAGGKGLPYNHAQFDAVATAAVVTAYDLTNKVATMAKYHVTSPQTAYPGGLPYASDVGFFEWSLAAHYVMHPVRSPGADSQTGGAPVLPIKFYLQDGETTPEKRLKFGLAEIILEGLLKVTIEVAWDKYSCFRIHNFNAVPATVIFAGSAEPAATVTLSAYGCATVRRDWDGGRYVNYRSGHTYFFKVAGNDPKFYWFMPTVLSGVATIGPGNRMANSMQANNLTNPAILFDWIQYFQRDVDGVSVFAGLNEDPTVQCDIGKFYSQANSSDGAASWTGGAPVVPLFGDPANSKTLLGDLLHHRGDILVFRGPKGTFFEKDVVMERMTFNGYATIRQDFGAQGMSVTENAAGNLVITNTDPQTDCYLVPVGTNLFKQGDNLTQRTPFQDFTMKGTSKVVTYRGVSAEAPGIVIENAVFESAPEQAWLGNLTLASSGPKLIQQPVATVATPQRVWQDIYSPVTNGNPDPSTWQPISITVVGRPQTTLDWTVDVNDLLTLPAIKDGGSGYPLGALVRLAGGVGEPAVVRVAGVSGGKVTAITISSGGDYITGPDDPNQPVQTYPPSPTGNGLVLWHIQFTQKVLNGIHKVTVADLLTLDWWGNPRMPGQISDYVDIGERKLTLTPQGLVLTFTETDSGLPGDKAGQSASLPTWASGKRGLPRHRAIRFRLHGWGFVGAPNDIEPGSAGSATVPPSAKSAMLSPRNGRYEYESGGYQNEVVAPNGEDFSLKQLRVTTNAQAKFLTRIHAQDLKLAAGYMRFWQISYPTPKTPVQPVLALLPEMYNALARAVNALTAGTPLQWQCLYFNVGGKIINLDPQFSLGFGLGTSGAMSLTGVPTGFNNNFYTGPRPMNQFGAFDQGSIYEALCNELNIQVRTEADLPGSPDHSLSYFRGKCSAPAVYLDSFAVKVADATCTPSSTVTPLTYPPYAIDPLQPITGVEQADLYGGTLSVLITTELLSTAKLVNGEATGSKCLGTYDRAKQDGFSYPYFPLGDSSGGYYVADDGSGYIARAGGVYSEEINVLGGPPTAGQAFLPDGTSVNLAFPLYRWVQIEDIRAVVTRYGFPFIWREVVTPCELRYFEDPTEQVIIAAQGGTVEFGASAFYPRFFHGGPPDANVRPAIQLGPGFSFVVAKDWQRGAEGEIKLCTAQQHAFSNSGFPGHGTLIKFCPQAKANAQWKLPPPAAPTVSSPGAPTSVNGAAGYPVEVVNIAARWKLSPWFRYLNVTATVSLIQVDGTGTPHFLPGVSLSGMNITVAQRPSTHFDGAQLAVHYPITSPPAPDADHLDEPDLTAVPYREGTLFDQWQVFGVNLYSTFPVVPIPVQMNGQAAWRKQTDFWGSLDTVYAALGMGNYGGSADPIPWAFVPATQSFAAQISGVFKGGEGNGLTVFKAWPDQRYWGCFSLAYFDLTKVVF